MDVSRIRALRGPNLWSRHTAIEAIISCTEDERAISNIPGFETRLRDRFPEISLLQPTGADNVISMAHAIEYATLGLQAQAGCPVTFSRTTQTTEAGIYQVVVEYSEEAVWPAGIRAGAGALPRRCRGSPIRPGQRPAPDTRARRRGAPRSEHRLHCLCRRRAPHSLSPADRRQHGSVWLGQ